MISTKVLGYELIDYNYNLKLYHLQKIIIYCDEYYLIQINC